MKKQLITEIEYCNECSWLLPPVAYGIPFYPISTGKPQSVCSKKTQIDGKFSDDALLPNRFSNFIVIPDWCPLEDVVENA